MFNMELNIMLIDDDEASHLIHNVKIEEAGICPENVISYYNVDKAINALSEICKSNSKKDWPHYIFLDINMPQKTGYDFIDEFELIESPFELPKIYFVSSSINPRDLRRAEELKLVHGFKSKFIDTEFFKSLIPK